MKYNTYGVFELKDGGILRHHTEKYIKDLLTNFEELEYRTTKFKTVSGNISNGFYYIGKAK